MRRGWWRRRENGRRRKWRRMGYKGKEVGHWRRRRGRRRGG